MMGAAGAGGAETKYIENNFSTQVYKGDGGATRTITSGVDLSTDGGLVITKNRSTTDSWMWGSTPASLGTGRWIPSNSIFQRQIDAQSYKAFNDDGYTVGTTSGINGNGNDIVGYSFRKAPGFLDIVEYVGNGASSRNISHNLGSVPGWMVIMCTTKSENKTSWHRGLTPNHSVYIDSANGASNIGAYPQSPTDTQFTIGSYPNINGETYVAWIFAGGASTAATARSVEFDGSGDALTTSTSSDYTFGTGDFTVEHWINTGSTAGATSVIDARTDYTNNWTTYLNTDFTYNFYAVGGNRIVSTPLAQGTWNHVALCRSSGTTTLYLNGTSQGTYSDSNNYTNTTLKIGLNFANGHAFIGKISNFRVVKGTAVYTSSFKPPYEPLTNITNTKLLCCNNSSVTGTTVGTVTSSGNPTASTDIPFDDPAGFTFGENENENIIKCGSYVGNGSSTGPEINLGWEPQWILLKRTSGANSWALFDCMRGIVTEGYDPVLEPNGNGSEYTTTQYLDLTSTGFKLKGSFNQSNADGDTYIFTCIRCSDGYVGKPYSAGEGTSVFAMDNGSNSSTIPLFDTGFPVDFALNREPASTENWFTGARLTGRNYMFTSTNAAETAANDWVWDSNVGWAKGAWGSSYQSWMWKRHAGFDVVTWSGTNSSVVRRHNLGRTPEMIWFKSRSSTRNWRVYHKGLNGGTNPEDYAMQLNSSSAEASNTNYMTSTAPTSTTFVAGNDDDTNGSGKTYIAMLFASVNGISKVGYYDGTGSVGLQITTGFSPRFLILKKVNGNGPWYVLDTTRGWAAGNDQYLQLDTNDAQVAYEFGAPNATGFQLDITASQVNESGGKYIYYAHA